MQILESAGARVSSTETAGFFNVYPPAEDITVHSPIIVDGKACDLQGGDVPVYASFADFKVLHKGPGRHLLFLIQLVEDYP